MNRLGSIKLAREIKAYDRDNELPPGWTYVTHGGRRHVYRGPDGLIYKVDRPVFDSHRLGNEQEFETFEYLQKKRYSWAPTFAYKAGIIIMPYYRKYYHSPQWDRRRTDDEIQATLAEIYATVRDAEHDPNIGLRNDDSLVLLDGGNGSHEYPPPPRKRKGKPPNIYIAGNTFTTANTAISIATTNIATTNIATTNIATTTVGPIELH